MRKWRAGTVEEMEFKEAKRGYKKLCERKKKKKNEKWIEVAKETRTEGQIWEIIRREKKERSVRVLKWRSGIGTSGIWWEK